MRWLWHEYFFLYGDARSCIHLIMTGLISSYHPKRRKTFVCLNPSEPAAQADVISISPWPVDEMAGLGRGWVLTVFERLSLKAEQLYVICISYLPFVFRYIREHSQPLMNLSATSLFNNLSKLLNQTLAFRRARQVGRGSSPRLHLLGARTQPPSVQARAGHLPGAVRVHRLLPPAQGTSQRRPSFHQGHLIHSFPLRVWLVVQFWLDVTACFIIWLVVKQDG